MGALRFRAHVRGPSELECIYLQCVGLAMFDLVLFPLAAKADPALPSLFMGFQHVASTVPVSRAMVRMICGVAVCSILCWGLEFGVQGLGSSACARAGFLRTYASMCSSLPCFITFPNPQNATRFSEDKKHCSPPLSRNKNPQGPQLRPETHCSPTLSRNTKPPSSPAQLQNSPLPNSVPKEETPKAPQLSSSPALSRNTKPPISPVSFRNSPLPNSVPKQETPKLPSSVPKLTAPRLCPETRNPLGPEGHCSPPLSRNKNPQGPRLRPEAHCSPPLSRNKNPSSSPATSRNSLLPNSVPKHRPPSSPAQSRSSLLPTCPETPHTQARVMSISGPPRGTPAVRPSCAYAFRRRGRGCAVSLRRICSPRADTFCFLYI